MIGLLERRAGLLPANIGSRTWQESFEFRLTNIAISANLYSRPTSSVKMLESETYSGTAGNQSHGIQDKYWHQLAPGCSESESGKAQSSGCPARKGRPEAPTTLLLAND